MLLERVGACCCSQVRSMYLENTDLELHTEPRCACNEVMLDITSDRQGICEKAFITLADLLISCSLVL